MRTCHLSHSLRLWSVTAWTIHDRLVLALLVIVRVRSGSGTSALNSAQLSGPISTRLTAPSVGRL